MVNTWSGDRRYDLVMSEMPPSGPSYGQSASGFPVTPTSAGPYPVPAGPPPWSNASSQPSRWLTFATLAIALIGTGLAVVGWYRPTLPPAPTPTTSPSYTDQQITEAKARSCKAFETVDKGVTLQTNGDASGDPAMAKAQGANARLATISGGWYLKARLDPATPAELSTAIRHLSEVLLDLGANYEAGVKDDDTAQAALKSETNSTFSRVAELCK
jgi:hypothetical protein